ncbi:Spc7-domain-containing protein [Hortaea werneckii]|nr:Spc7-domain-containing protein [Hortaea werneckii]
MAGVDNKENVAPTSSDPLQHKSSPTKKGARKGRSRSIGPGELSSDAPKQSAKDDAKNRRKSAYTPATKSIISSEQEKKERQAARRKTLANRRVSFAPEATLHTWDVVEFMRDPTTSTDASDQTRRESNSTRSSGGGSPFKSPARGDDYDDQEPPSTPPDQEDEPDELPGQPAHQRDLHRKQRRRSSGIPPMNFNDPNDFGSSSGMSGSSDMSGSEDENGDESDDATGTAMSLDTGDDTVRSGDSASSTSSSARLEAALRQAAETAGTRGIDYDEHGDDVSMEIAEDTVTNAFKPWQRGAPEEMGSASLDQENVNPFSPAFKANLVSGAVQQPQTIEEEDTGDMSMDVTKAIGGITKQPQSHQYEPEEDETGDMSMDVTKAVGGIMKRQPQRDEPDEDETGDMSMDVTKAVGGITKAPAPAQETQLESSPFGDGTMELTQVVGKIHPSVQASPTARSGQKRRRSTTATGSPGGAVPAAQSKRRRSSAARSSMGDDTMDLTMAVGGIQNNGSPAKNDRRRSMRRRSSGVASNQGEATMDITQAVGGIKNSNAPRNDHTTSSFDENEELSMDFTAVLGGIKAGEKNGPTSAPTSTHVERPQTPRETPSPVRAARANTTPKDQERFTEAPDSGPIKLLTPLFQKQANRSAEKSASNEREKRRKTISPAQASWTGAVFDPERQAYGPERPFEPVDDHAENENASLEKETSQAGTPKASPLKQAIEYPKLPSAEKPPSSARKSPAAGSIEYRKLPSAEKSASARKSPSKPPSAKKSPMRTPVNGNKATPNSELQQQLDEQLQGQEPSPTAEKAQRTPARSAHATPEKPRSAAKPTATPENLRSPAKHSATPERPSPTKDARSHLTDSIKLMSTPRKETLKSLTPKKSKQGSPAKNATPRPRPTPKGPAATRSSPAKQLGDDLVKAQSSGKPAEKVRLQSFLEEAGIRFMDLTATKRRLTTAPTPSKARRTSSSVGMAEDSELRVTLENAVVAAACTQPEHDMFQHACNELKRYISDGKKVIKQLETETYRETPPLIQAYLNASADRKSTLDAQMRDMKTHARLRSKEMWYAWRSQLLEDLMKGLSGIGEGLLKDDEVLQRAEEVLDQVLPGIEEKHVALQQEAERLENEVQSTSEEEKEELEQARSRIVEVDGAVDEKRRVLEELERETEEQDQMANHLEESKVEFAAAIKEAERVREACRGVSLQEIADLKESIKNLEETYGWSITSSSASPPTITMTYKSQLQLFFHPLAFHAPSQQGSQSRPNAPIGLQYIVQDRNEQPKELTTTLRFFLQLIRASLHALPQCETRVPDLLSLVSGGWDTALEVAESERRLALETLTTSRIVSDERLAIEATLLLPKVRTKVRVAFELLAAIGEDMGLSTTTEITGLVVYGEKYNEGFMKKFITERVHGVAEGWSESVREMREALIAKGAKGMRK